MSTREETVSWPAFPPFCRFSHTHGALSLNQLAALIASLAIGFANPSQGQTVRGQVIDSISGLPVGAGFVVLIGADNREIARTLTSVNGTFTLDMTEVPTGPVRLRSERIGYRLYVSRPFTLPTSGLDGLTIYIMALPTQLETIEARGASECRIRPSESERTAVVWEEARKALSAASWTASTQSYRVMSDIAVVDMDGQQEDKWGESHRPSIGLSTNPFVSRSPAELVQTGYMVEESGSYVYTSPDAHVLQSEFFLDTHCFRLTDSDDESLIGLAFEPVPSQRLPDVEGVLWIDRASWELRSLEYEYTNVPAAQRADDPARGSVQFLQLPSGAWIVNEWEIEFPTAFREQLVGEFDRRVRRRVESFRRVGGQVLTIHEPTGALVYETQFAEVVGVVRDDSRGGAVLPNAIVHVPNTWFADTTNGEGRFHLRLPISGEYGVAVSHPRIDSLVFGPPAIPVHLTRGNIVEASIRVPTLAELRETVCADRPVSPDQGVLVGVVTDAATRTPVRDASVVGQWQHITTQLDFSNRHALATTDEDGRFALCGLEHARPTMVYALDRNGMSDVFRVAFEPGRIEIGRVAPGRVDTEIIETGQKILRRDLEIALNSGPNTLLAGAVIDNASGSAIAGAHVAIVGRVQRARTDSAGLFTVTGLPPGIHRIRVTKAGYATRSGDVRVDRDQPTIIDVSDLTLTPVPQLVGVVREEGTNRPIPLSWMTLVGPTGDSVTRSRADSLGRFTLTAPRDDRFTLVARRLGFAPDTLGPFELRAGRAVETVVAMRPGVFALDPIEVTAEAADQYLSQVGFCQRQRANRGHFMDRAAIEERLGSSPDVFRLMAALPGVSVVDPPPGQFGSRIKLNRGGFSTQGCNQGPLIFVDGFRMDYGSVGGGQPTYDAIGMVARPEEIQGIEVYRTPSQVPVQYGGAEAACGVILIWTWKGG